MPRQTSREAAIPDRAVLPDGLHGEGTGCRVRRGSPGALQGAPADSGGAPRLHHTHTRSRRANMTDDPALAEVRVLADRYFTSEATTAEILRLNELLHGNPPAQLAFLEMAGLHARLQWEFGPVELL